MKRIGVLAFVLLVSGAAVAQLEAKRGITTKAATTTGATGPESYLGDAPGKVKVSAKTDDKSCKYRLDMWNGAQRAWVAGTAEKPCSATPETVSLQSSYARVFITQLNGAVTFTLDSSQ